jgi:hypothetical protein
MKAVDFGLPRSLVVALSLLATTSLLLGADPASALPDTNTISKLRPPRGEIPPTFWEQYGWWVVVGVVLLAAFAGGLVWFLLRPRPPVLVPPHVRARQMLEPLRQRAEDGVVLSRVSQALRYYVAAAFVLPPGEMNTSEFCRAIAGQEELGPQLSGAIQDFVRQCDVRKFAPLPGAPPPMPATPPVSAVTQALRLIEQAESRLAAVRQAASQAATPKSGGPGGPE